MMAKEVQKIKIHPERCVGCRLCQLECSFTFEGRFEPFSARIKVDWTPDECEISFTDECTECGVCADRCLYGALKRIQGGS